MDISKIKKNVKVCENGCWVWQKSINSSGYGQLTENKKYWLAHRYAYSCFNDDIFSSQVLRHTCHNTKCCNPEHLILGTHKENYHDSKTQHDIGNIKKSKIWTIGNKTYTSLRVAAKETLLHQGTIIKHSKNGVFDIYSYRQSCKVANKMPKI